MEVAYKKDGKQNYMIFRDCEVDESDYQFQMLMYNNIEGLIPVSIKKINDHQELYYDITSKVSMQTMYAKKGITGSEVYQFLQSLNLLAEKLKEYLLNLDDIVFEPESIFIERKEQKYYYCYLPNNKGDFHENIRNLLDRLLEYINYDDKKSVLVLYGMQQITMNSDFTITELIECAKENFETNKQRPKENYSIREVRGGNVYTSNEAPREEIDQKEKSGIASKILQWKRKKKYQSEDEITGIQTFGQAEEIQEEMMYKDTEEETRLLMNMEIEELFTLKSVNAEKLIKISPTRFPCIIGKSIKSSDICIDNPVISRVHMRIFKEKGSFLIEDLNSTNGTYLNNEKLEAYSPQCIRQGDEIMLANINFVVE